MNVAGFMSGSGTNLVKILEAQQRLSASGASPYKVSVIFTDNASSNASAIGERFGVPVVTHDIMGFYRERGRPDKMDLNLRPGFDRISLEMLEGHPFDLAALCGYMSIVTAPLLEALPGRLVNVHPADLSVMKGGKRKYTGDRAVHDAIAAGEPGIHSTTHIVRAEVDGGEILLVSKAVPVELPPGLTPAELRKPGNRKALDETASSHQDRLKETGDWVIFPLTLQMIGEGRFALDGNGGVFLDGRCVPAGKRL